MKCKKGFTLVEVAIIVSVIAILTSITVGLSANYQVNVRDNSRQAKATIVAEALERYYNENGEYPSPMAVVSSSSNSGAVVASRLVVSQDALVMPKASTGTTNSIASSLNSSDALAYVAASATNNTSCQNDVNGGCDVFTLSYKKESNSETVTIESRHGDRAAFSAPPAAPGKPTITAFLGDDSISVTSSAASCASGLTAKYSFQMRAGSIDWLEWEDWQTSRVVGYGNLVDSVTYSFRVRTRCDSGSTVGEVSIASDPVSVTYLVPPEAPAAPTITAAMSGTNAVGTSGTTTCNVGIPEYQLRYRSTSTSTMGAWSSWTSWSSSVRTYSVAALQGHQYGFQVQARCNHSGVTSDDYGLSSVATVVRPISAPSAPTVSYSQPNSTQTLFSTNVGSCPTGTSLVYNAKSLHDGGYESSWFSRAVYDGATSYTLSTSSQGYIYTVQFRRQCTSTYTASDWSAIGSNSYFRSINTPGVATNFNHTVSSDRITRTFTWTAPTCGTGTQTQYRYNSWIGVQDPNSGSSVWWTATGTNGWLYGDGGWSAQGNWTSQFPVISSNGAYPYNVQVAHRVQYICVNTVTGRTSAWGSATQSATFKT